MDKKYFGTDGIRGYANKFPLTPEFILKLSLASAYVFKKRFSDLPKKILIGMDTRISSHFITSTLIAGFNASGFDVINLGITTTPSISYILSKYEFTAGIMISASHNPYYDNGIKFFSNSGKKLSNEIEKEIEQHIDNNNFSLASAEEIGKSENNKTFIKEYIEFLKSNIRFDFLVDKTIVIDFANGAGIIGKKIFKDILSNTIFINDSPDGKNINYNCGSTHLDTLIENVKKYNAFIGIALDGDGDRMLAVSNDGNIINGDYLIALYAKYLKEKNKLKNNCVILTLMSNLGLINYLKSLQIDHKIVNVGDKYVYEGLEKNNAILGGEQSGHIILKDKLSTGDGLLSTCFLFSILSEYKITPNNILGLFKEYPQKIKNIKLKDKQLYTNNKRLKNKIETLSKSLGNNARLIVRPSGTEPLLRIMAEAQNEKKLWDIINTAETIIKEHIEA